METSFTQHISKSAISSSAHRYHKSSCSCKRSSCPEKQCSYPAPGNRALHKSSTCQTHCNKAFSPTDRQPSLGRQRETKPPSLNNEAQIPSPPPPLGSFCHGFEQSQTLLQLSAHGQNITMPARSSTPYPKPSLAGKLDILPALGSVLLSGLYALATGYRRSDKDEPSLYLHVMYAALRRLVDRLSAPQSQ